MGTIYNILLYAVNLTFYLVLFALMLRMLFQFFRASATNPVAVTIAHYTNPIILPLREYLPRTRYIDLSTFTLWLVVDFLKYLLIVYLEIKQVLTPAQFALVIPADFIMQLTTLIFYATIFYTVINFVAPGLQSVGMDTLKTLAEPPMAMMRKFIPASGGFDFSPFLIILIAKCIQIGITQFIPAAYFF